MTDINDAVSIGDFAKEIAVTGQTVNGWIEKFNDNSDGNPVEPIAKFGNTNVYDRRRLLELAADKGNSAAVKAAGYVHPDKYDALERSYFEALRRIGELESGVEANHRAWVDASDRLTAMEIERDHFERENSKNMETIQLLQRKFQDHMIDDSDIEE